MATGTAVGIRTVRSIDYIPSKNLWIAANRGDIDYLNQAVSRRPDDAFRWHALCQGYLTREDFGRAAQACRRSLELDRTKDYPVFTAGVVAVCSGDTATVAAMREKLKELGSVALADLNRVAATGCDRHHSIDDKPATRHAP